MAQGLSCSAARGIFPDQGSNPCPLRRQGSSYKRFYKGLKQCNPNSQGSECNYTIYRTGGTTYSSRNPTWTLFHLTEFLIRIGREGVMFKVMYSGKNLRVQIILVG